MQQVLYIWWWMVYTTRDAFVKKLETKDYRPFEIKKRWRSCLQEQLWENYQVAILDMPNRTLALYKEWKIQFEKIFAYLVWSQILIAHSLWTTFILKYLTENLFPRKIKQLHFVSSLIDNKDLPPENAYLGDFSFDITKISNIQNICENIFLYHSKNDTAIPISQWERLYELLPSAKFEIFENRWHMKIENFPEIVQNIKTN